MWFGKRKIQKELQTEETDKIKKEIEDIKKILEEQQKEQEKLFRRQSASFEDLLDEIQEWRADQDKQAQQNTEQMRKEHALLQLICFETEQLQLLKQQLLSDTTMAEEKHRAWEEHFRISEKELLKFMKPCGLEQTGEKGEPADYSIHDILETIDTEDGREGEIAKIYSKGLLYGGRTIKKAQVAVLKKRMENNAHE